MANNIITKAVYSGTFARCEQLPADQVNEIALVGRSNVGKSSLINAIAHRKNLAKSSSTPGKTRTINLYTINNRWNLADLPGYGYARVSKQEQRSWQVMLESYFKQRTQLAGAVQLLDIRREPSRQDQQMLAFLSALQLPVLLVATKADKVSRGSRAKQLQIIQKTLQLPSNHEVIAFSAVIGLGLDEVVEALFELADPVYKREKSG